MPAAVQLPGPVRGVRARVRAVPELQPDVHERGGLRRERCVCERGRRGGLHVRVRGTVDRPSVRRVPFAVQRRVRL